MATLHPFGNVIRVFFSSGESESTCRSSVLRHNTTIIVDFISLALVITIITALILLREIPGVTQYVLAVLLLMRYWMGPIPMDVPDRIVAIIFLVSLSRSLLGQTQLAVSRIAVCQTSVGIYWLIRVLHHRSLIARWVPMILSFISALLSLWWVLLSQRRLSDIQNAGFNDVTSLKGTIVSLLNGSVNEWATCLFLFIVFQLATLRPLSHTVIKTNSVALGVIGLSTAGLFLTFSRGAYAALFVLVVLSVSIICRSRSIAGKTSLIVAIAIVVLGSFAAANAVSGGGVLQTVSVFSTEQQRRSGAGRLHVWANTLKLASESWLFGSGPGTFALRYLPMAAAANEPEFVGRPLNTALLLFTEEGILGLSLSCLLGWLVIARSLKHGLDNSNEWSYQSGILLAGLCGFWIREMTFSSLMEEPVVMSLYWLLVACLVNLATTTGWRSTKSDILTMRMTITVFCIALLWSYYLRDRTAVSDILAIKAAEQINSHQFNNVSTLLSEVVATNPTPYNFSLRGLSTALQYMPTFDPKHPIRDLASLQTRAQLESSLADYERAMASNRDDDVWWNNRGWLRLALGENVDNVISDLLHASRIDGTAAPYRISMGLLYERTGRIDLAVDQYSMAFSSYPAVLDSLFAVDLKTRSPDMWRKSINEGSVKLAEADPLNKNIVIRARRARLFLAQHQEERAYSILQEVVHIMPQFSRPWLTLARIELDNGNLALAELHLGKALFLAPIDTLNLLYRARLAAMSQDVELSHRLEEAATKSTIHNVSRHAMRVSRLYKSHAVVDDDILPAGMLAYCSPSLVAIQ